jgi:hypothetical protein
VLTEVAVVALILPLSSTRAFPLTDSNMVAHHHVSPKFSISSQSYSIPEIL